MEFRIKIILISIVMLCGCKSSLISKQNSEEKVSNTHKRLENLIKKGSIDSFYSLFNKTSFNPNHVQHKTTLLFEAVADNNEDICRFLIEKGANVNFVSNYGTVMHWSLEKNNMDIAYLLLDNGYNPKIEKEMKNNEEPLGVLSTFLIRKNKKKGVNFFEELLIKGMDPKLLDKDGASTIHLAVYFNSVELIRLLHQYNVDINLKIKGSTNEVFMVNNYTPLMLACYLTRPEIVEELISFKDLKINIQSKDGKTALDIAKQKNNETIIELLTIANNQ